jgi:hypothetical protein
MFQNNIFPSFITTNRLVSLLQTCVRLILNSGQVIYISVFCFKWKCRKFRLEKKLHWRKVISVLTLCLLDAVWKKIPDTITIHVFYQDSIESFTINILRNTIILEVTKLQVNTHWQMNKYWILLQAPLHCTFPWLLKWNYLPAICHC